MLEGLHLKGPTDHHSALIFLLFKEEKNMEREILSLESQNLHISKAARS